MSHHTYCTTTLGGTARGIGVLRALGGGVLVTPFSVVPDLEDGIEFFGHVPLSCDVLILDSIRPRKRHRGYGKVLVYGEDVEPGPVLPRDPDELDLTRAEAWWSSPPPVKVRVGRITYDVEPHFDRRVLCVCSSYRPREQRDFAEAAEGRVVMPSRRYFYWPAMELMALADEVVGGGMQVMAERLAVENQARRVAADVRRLAVDRTYSFG
jgi:hypothetical protein